MLPLAVLEKARDELVCYGDSGMSVMEMSHRSSDYDAIIKAAEQNLRRLMNIPDNYKVLFLQGGASTQFAAVPLNLMNRNHKADYIVSGQFSGKAFKEAQKYGDAVCVATSAADNFTPMRTMSISASTTPSTVRSSTTFPTPAIFRWLPTCPPASCPSRSM